VNEPSGDRAHEPAMSCNFVARLALRLSLVRVFCSQLFDWAPEFSFGRADSSFIGYECGRGCVWLNMSLFFDDNDEHFLALSNLLSRPIELPLDSLPPATFGPESGSGSSSSRSASGELSPKEGFLHENLYKTELCRTWEAVHSCQYG
jgi:hypothetical protein